MKFDMQKVSSNARQASTEDLLDRVTIFRAGMEPEALAIFEAELRERGISRAAVEAHGRDRDKSSLHSADGTVLQCSFCRKPAVAQGWGWQRLWKVLPLFPRPFRYCQDHRVRTSATNGAN